MGELSVGKMKGLSRYVIGLCLFSNLFLVSSERCLGYVLPSGQLISYMVKNFSEFKTLVISQTTWQEDERHEEGWESFKEKIWMKFPSLFHSQTLNPAKKKIIEPDTSFRSLFMADSGAWASDLLIRMGINLNAVGLTRVDETVAYRIGGKDPDAPKILIEKERFLPLALTYLFPGYSDVETITVLFSDYRKMGKGWYPFEITYFDPRGFRENYMIDTLQANVPIDPAVFGGTDTSSDPDQTSEEGEELRKVERPKAGDRQSVHTID
jgi:hypothetical protein